MSSEALIAWLFCGGILMYFWRQRNAFRMRCYLLEQKYVYDLSVDRAIAAQLYTDGKLLGWRPLPLTEEPSIAEWSGVNEKLENRTRILLKKPSSKIAAFWDMPVYRKLVDFEPAPMDPHYDPETGKYL